MSNIITIEELAESLVESLAESLVESLATSASLIGLDIGSKTIGIAVSDTRRIVATARETLKKKKFTIDAGYILELAKQENAAALVIGLPLDMDGSEGPRAQASRAFARNLSVLDDIPVLFWDERLTTVAAERAMLEADLSRRKRAERIDAVAAAIILQGVLDRLSKLQQA